MDIKIKVIDESEAVVTFSGHIIISREQQLDFEKSITEIINEYAL